ncbi:16S rRNA (cytidine(1402)-2'-O)-methyltransferase [Chromatium okenii]|uniref:16S rRNA (cytidine(1402)-2'-O)-methyltransferase n=1 Tax=Chromatium okenii TaxID=61644 RepID=UPI0026ED7318|nr:16S rRNA (cytidine(1402)-2'-O)-methyltransferase [Chromatium okenii]MBV5310349.1 16S rRNA (cytidine(1402)-2'-O)-methyltransferase [Chromatium okenii]
MTLEPGTLYVVATPIGNLADMTERARLVLAKVDLIAAEDTRETLHLLNHFGISAPRLLAYHDHNEAGAVPRLVAALEAGQTVALVSDAGTPLLSDPGYRIVVAARERGLAVVPVPGACAAICALSAAGLPTDRFLFLGFPPRTSAQRRTWLAAVAEEPGTLIIYESAKRVLETLADIGAVLGERRVVLAREMTKRFETFLSGSAEELRARVASDPDQQRGELVMVVEGRAAANDAKMIEATRVLKILLAHLPLRQAVDATVQITGIKKNLLYQLGLALNE